MKFLDKLENTIDEWGVKAANIGVGTHIDEVIEDNLPPGFAGDLGIDVLGGPDTYITNVIKMRRRDTGEERMASNHGLHGRKGDIVETGNRALARFISRR